MAEAKPVILAVDDDVPVLRAVERDLRTRYGAEYRIVAASAAAEALDAVRALTQRGASVALFVVDQRMPHMTGIEFLAQALELQPEARRVLLTAYADTDVAIQAINDIRLDHYILKPWDPPEERLFPITDDLLADWSATNRPSIEGLRLLAGRWSPRGHDIRDYLTRNQVPYVWLDPVDDPAGRRLVASLPADAGADAGADASQAIVVFPDGTPLRDPTHMQIAERLGLRVKAANPFYDLVIVGGGPAGLAAAVYGASEGLRTLLVEREAPGGQAGTTSLIENYLGFPAGLSGGDLARRALTQARRLGAEFLQPQEAVGLRREDPYRVVSLADGSQVSCQTVLVATGVSYRQLDLPGAAELAGAGIYYGAATTEAALYRGQEVAVVGGGNSAGQAAVHLARFATKVYVLIRTTENIGMSQYLIDQMAAIPNIEVQLSSSVTAVQGDGHLASITLRHADAETQLPVAACFVFIGQQPRTDWLEGILVRDPGGFLPTGGALVEDGKPPAGWGLPREPFLLESSMPGVFVAGDVRHRSVKRIASAVGEGSMSIAFVHQYLASI